MKYEVENPCGFCGSNELMIGGDLVPAIKMHWMHYVECKNKRCQARGPRRKTKKGAMTAYDKKARN